MGPSLLAIPQNAFAVVASNVTRSFSSATPAPGSSLTVSLAVNVIPGDTFYAIDEIVPAGWVISNPGTGDTSQAGHVKWIVLSGAASITYQYIVTVPALASGISTFSGSYGFGANPTGAVLGSTTVTVAAAPVLTTINVSPLTPSVVASATQSFTATTLDQNSAPIAATVVWSSGNTAVATINSSTGLATSLTAGTTTITATSGAVSGNTILTVTAPVVTFTLTASAGSNGVISPTGVTTVNSGANQTFTITPNAGYHVAGVLVDGASVGAVTSYTFTNVLANHTISASFAITPVFSSIQVVPTGPSAIVGGTQQFTATALDQNGVAMVTQPTFVWASGSPAIATVGVNGLATGVSVGGPITITATSGIISGTANLTITAAPVPPALTTINVTPLTPSVLVGATQQFTGATLDQNGAAFTATVAWTSSNPAIGTINSSTGLFTAVASGTTTITATSGAVSGNTMATVTVQSSSSGGGGYISTAITSNRTEISGCAFRTTGYSIVTGQSCVTNIPHNDGQVLGAEKFHFTLYLKNGSKGNEVMELQKFLNGVGYGVLRVDGSFGPLTKAALIKFQLANKLKGDGLVGPITRAFLNK
jgi:uncharacterized protein YjdB